MTNMSSHPEFPTLLAFDGLEACILVDGKEVPHYAVECNEAKREISCWIESQAEKPFAYQFRRIRKEYDCATRVYLDGKSVERSGIRKGQDGSCLAPRHSVRISDTEARKLIFGSLELTDDDKYLENSPQNIGEIKIVFEKARNIRMNSVAIPKWHNISPLSEEQKVHERSKKALSHRVRYGEIEQTEAPKPGTVRFESCGIWATFVFRYRPLAMLKATGIAPIVPPPQEELVPRTPAPVNKKRKVSEVKQESDDDEEEQDDARERALLAELEKVRQKKLSRNGGSGHSKRVKQEPQTYFTPGEIIDLT